MVRFSQLKTVSGVIVCLREKARRRERETDGERITACLENLNICTGYNVQLRSVDDELILKIYARDLFFHFVCVCVSF